MASACNALLFTNQNNTVSVVHINPEMLYDVIAAANDRSKGHNGKPFSFMCLKTFPALEVDKPTFKTITLIDAVWFEKGTNQVICAFEVEKSTSIYSGILRLKDLYHSFPDHPPTLYLVVPDKREKDVVFQLQRPSMRVGGIEIHYILFSALRADCDAICRFGDHQDILKKIAKVVSPLENETPRSPSPSRR